MTNFLAGLDKQKLRAQQNSGTNFLPGLQREESAEEFVKRRYGLQNNTALPEDEPGFFEGLKSGFAGVLAGQARFGEVNSPFGGDNFRDAAEYFEGVANENPRTKFPNGAEFSWDYITDPQGLRYDTGAMLGSSAALGAETAAGAALIANTPLAAGAAAVGRAVPVAAKLWKSPLGKVVVGNVAQTPLEATSEGGGLVPELRAAGYNDDEIKEIANRAAMLNIGALGLSNLIQSYGATKVLGLLRNGAGKSTVGDIAKRGVVGAVGGMATNAGEEGVQSAIGDIAMEQPVNWEEVGASARTGAATGAVMGAVGGAGGAYLQSRAEQAAQQAKENTEGKPGSFNTIEAVRMLKGKIPYYAEDGTNCMRTLGKALVGTPYEGQINVDQAVGTAREKNQLMSPGEYTPKPGDIIVANGGTHVGMVTENGGVIQNGASHNGVWESDISPQEMFDSVDYYIRTSDYYNGQAGVAKADLRSEYADEVSADNATDRAIEQMNANTPNIKLPEREEINFGQTAQSEADDNAALSDYSEADARRTAGRTEADDYMGLTGEEQESGQAWDNYRAPQRTGGFKFTGGRASNYNPTEAMQTPFLNRIRQQEAQHRRDLEWYAMEEEKARRDIEAGKVQPNSQLVEKALKDNRLAGIIESAAQGNANAQRAFSVIRPDVRRALLQQIRERKADKNIFRQERKAPFTSGYFNNPQAFVGMNRLSQIERNIAESKIKMQEAKDAAERAAARAEMLQSAEEYFRSDAFDSPLEGVRNEIKGTQQGIKELLKPIVDTILAGGGERARLIETEDDYRKIRVGQNMPYYSELYKKYGRKPTMKELYDEARDIYTGDSSIAIPGWQRNAENEADFAHNKAVLKELDDNLDMYEELEKKFAAEPDGGRKNGQAEKGYDDENTARRQAEKKEADNQNAESENEVNKKTAESAESRKAKKVIENLNADDINDIIRKTNVNELLVGKTKTELFDIALNDVNSKIGKIYNDPLNNNIYFAPGNTETVESYTLHLIAGQNKPLEDVRVQRVMGLLLSDETIKNPLAIVRQGNGRKMYLAMYQGAKNMTNGLVIGVEEGQNGRVVTSTLTADKKGDKKAALREFKKRVSGADEVLYIWEGLTGRPRPSADQQASQSDAELHLSGDNIISQNANNSKKGTSVTDGSTRPSTAATNGSLSAGTNNNGGDGAAIVQAETDVRASIVAQNAVESQQQTTEEQQAANNAPDNTQESEHQAERSEQEQVSAPAERGAETQTEPSEKAKGRIGEKFNVFDSSADNYAREVEISKIKKVRGNYYYGDSRNATLYKIDDLETGRSDELAAEIENERRRIEEARAEKQERETKAEKNVDRSLSEFTKDLKPVQRGNLMKVLGKELNYGPDEGVKTRAEHMRDVLKNGNFVTSKQDGSKTEYRVYDGKEASGTFEIITKAEYDYYNWLKEQAEKKAEAKKQATKPTASKVAPKAKIEDFGEKIGGARKDVYGEWKELMQNAEKIDVKAVPLSKSWPEPDYDKLIENGANKSQVAFIRALRDAIPAKPRQSYGLGNWTKMVESFRRAANNILNGSDGYEWKSAEQYLKDKRAELNTVVFDIIGRAKLYEEVGHKYSLRGISFNQHAYSVFNGKRYDKPKAFWVVEQKTKATAFNNFPRMLAYGETEAAALEQFKKNYEMLLNKDTKKKHVTFNFYFNGKGDDREYIIGKKIGRNAVKLKGGFKTLKEAYEYRDSHYDELVSQLEKMKEVPMERGDINRPRVGQDMRGGLDVTPEMFTEAFGFRGVEFGNYVENDRRQQDLNNAYDALMDMAAILDINPKAISLNGELGLAFGARGKGGVNPAAAHYEPDKVVINLTKMNGAGSLGHEWLHALDNMFGKNARSVMASNSPDVTLRYFTDKGQLIGDMRPEIVDAFAGIKRAILKTKMFERSQKLDKTRSKPYWSTIPEMYARAFEKYLIAKLNDQNASNDYLVNVLPESVYNESAQNFVDKNDTYPYPTEAEMPEIRAAFDKLFAAIEQVETDKGIMLREDMQNYTANDIMNVSEEYYQQALFDYPEIESSERVKKGAQKAIQSTLDFGALPGEIKQAASEELQRSEKGGQSDGNGKSVQQSAQQHGADTDRPHNKIPRVSKTLGIGITRQLVNDGAFSLIGKKVHSLQQLAEYAQVLRHPGYEKFHRVYVGNDNKIIGHETISSMLPAESQIFEGNGTEPERRYAFERHQNIAYSNAVAKVYYIHNHPSGNPEPSIEDLSITKSWLKAESGDKFAGHLILDTTKYTYIDKRGKVKEKAIPEKKQVKYDVAGTPHAALGRLLDSTDVAVRLIKTLDDESKTTVFYLDTKLKVRAVVQLPEGVNKLSTAGLNRYLRLMAREHYSTSAVISTMDTDVYKKAKTLVENGQVLEVILTDERDWQKSGRVELERAGANINGERNFFGETSKSRKTERLLEKQSEYGQLTAERASAWQDKIANTFTNARSIERDGNNFNVTLPNGNRITIDVVRGIALSDEAQQAARSAHGIKESANIVAAGSNTVLDGNALMQLLDTSDTGVLDHEVLHAAKRMGLTQKENAALDRIMPEEAQADDYRAWRSKRINSSRVGKLWQKIVDLASKLQALLGFENRHNVYRKIESGEVWTRSGDNQSNGNNYSVTNTQITGETLVPVVDVTGLPKVNVNSNAVKTEIAKGLIGKTFRIIGSNGIGRVANVIDGKHLLNSSQGAQRYLPIRQQAISAIDEILNNAIYVDKHSDVRHGTNKKYIELYAVVKNKNNLTRFRIVAKEGDNTANEYEVKEAKFYDIIKDGASRQYAESIPSANIPKGMQAQLVRNAPSTISVAQLLAGVKDRNGKPYITKDGGLNYESEALKGIRDTQYSVEEVNPQVITPEEKAARAFTNTERKTTWQNVKDWVKKQREEFYRDWIDKNDSLHGLDEALETSLGRELQQGEKIYNRVQTLPATAAGMANALIEGDAQSIKALNERLKHKKLPHNVTLQMVLENINRKEMDKAHPDYLKKSGFNNWVDAFGAYLGSIRLNEMLLLHDEAYQQRVSEWEANGKKGKRPEYKPYILPEGLTQADLESIIRNAPQEFRKAANMYWQFNDNILTVMEDAGLISAETHKLLNTKYKYYCPLMRDFSDTASADNFIGGLSNGGRGIGNVSSTLKRISIEGSGRKVLNPLESTVKAVAVMCNRAERNKVGQMAVDLAEKGGLDGAIQKAEGTTADPKNCVFTVMFDGKKQAYKTTQELYGPIVGYNLPAAGFVLGVARNAARLLRAGATSSPSFIVRNLIRDTIFAGISSQNGFRPIVDTIRGAYALARDPRLRAEFKVAGVTQFNFYSSSEQIVKSLDEMAGGKDWHKYGAGDIWRALMKYPAMASEYAESATRMGEFMRAREKGLSLEEAAQAARELTLDFSRSGVQGEKVNQIVPFFNAVLQGGDKMVRLIKNDPVGTGVKLATYIILPSLALWAMNHDEDWYKELDPEIKATCWCLPGGIRIPKPQECGILFGSGAEAMLDAAFNDDPVAVGNWAKTFTANMAPSILPTVFLPLIEWQANYSFFRGQSITPQRLQNLPDELQYTPNTSAAARTIGGVTGLSPVKIDNTIRGYTGTMGMFIVQQFDWFANDKQNMPYKKVSEWPFLRDFAVNQNIQNRSVNDFYDMLGKANKQHAGYGKKGQPSAAVQGVRQAGRLISEAQKDIRALTVNPRLSPEAKRARIDQRKAYIKNVAEKANARYGRFFED